MTIQNGVQTNADRLIPLWLHEQKPQRKEIMVMKTIAMLKKQNRHSLTILECLIQINVEALEKKLKTPI